MFFGCTNLVSVNITNFSTENPPKKNKINLENINEQFNNERKELQLKIDNISNDLNNKGFVSYTFENNQMLWKIS